MTHRRDPPAAISRHAARPHGRIPCDVAAFRAACGSPSPDSKKLMGFLSRPWMGARRWTGVISSPLVMATGLGSLSLSLPPGAHALPPLVAESSLPEEPRF
jgi:hypothetical protein